MIDASLGCRARHLNGVRAEDTATVVVATGRAAPPPWPHSPVWQPDTAIVDLRHAASQCMVRERDLSSTPLQAGIW